MKKFFMILITMFFATSVFASPVVDVSKADIPQMTCSGGTCDVAPPVSLIHNEPNKNAEETNDRVYATQTVTGYRDAEGKIHLKGIGGEARTVTVSGPASNVTPLGWEGASVETVKFDPFQKPGS